MTIKADLLWRKEEMQYWIMALIGIIFVIWMFRYDKNHPNQIKKSNGKVQKPLHKRWWTWVIAVILIVGGLGNAMGLAADDEHNSASVAQTESKTKNEKSKNKKAVSYTKEQRISKEVKREQKIYKGEAKVAYKKEWNAITITPTSQSFTESVVAVIHNGDGESQDWKDLTDALKNLSITAYEKTKIPNISVALVNPNNTEKVLYTARNGKTTYDLAKDGD